MIDAIFILEPIELPRLPVFKQWQSVLYQVDIPYNQPWPEN
jgi:hypothetical protein